MPTQSPSAAMTPVPLASLSPLVTVTTAPANDNPSYTLTGGTFSTAAPGTVTTNGITYTSPGSAPAAVGVNAVLIGTIEASTAAYPKGTFGICQTVTAPSTGSWYLSMWVWEGGTEDSFRYADQEAAIFPSYSANVASGTPSYLFAEENCYVHPGAVTGSGTDAESCTVR